MRLETGRGPEGIALGDLFNAGRMDLAVANAADGTLSILRNNSTPGTLRFLPQQSIAIGGTPHRVAITDFDGDGQSDVLLSNNSARQITLLRVSDHSTTYLTFSPRLDLQAPSYLNQFALGDVDGDGRVDILVPVPDTDSLVIFRNTSRPGAIGATVAAHISTGPSPDGISVAEVCPPRGLDIIVANYRASTVSLFLNDEDENSLRFSRADFSTSAGPMSVAISSTGDAGQVVAVSGYDGNSISLLVPAIDHGKCSLVPIGTILTAKSPIALVLADFDGDQKVDAVAADHEDDSLLVLLGIARGNERQ